MVCRLDHPGEAESHCSAARTTDKWAPAFAGWCKICTRFRLIAHRNIRSFHGMSFVALKRKTMKTPPGWALEVFAR
jgi:hypothetical protein